MLQELDGESADAVRERNRSIESFKPGISSRPARTTSSGTPRGRRSNETAGAANLNWREASATALEPSESSM